MSVGLKIGEMSCIEYASMMGYADVLRALLDESMNAAILHQYFSLVLVKLEAKEPGKSISTHHSFH